MSTKASASKPHLFDRLILATKAFLDRKIDERQLRETVHDISEANLPYKIVPLSSLTRKEILKAFNLKVDTRDNELENVMPMPIPKHLAQTLALIDSAPSRSPTTEAIKLKGKRVYLGARLDYGIWYGEDETLCLNVLIVEAKRSDIELGATQALGYMATIHNECKKSSKRDATVYGMTSSSEMFSFLKISHDSKWLCRVVLSLEGKYEQPLGLLVHMFRRAALSSPTHSKQGSAQTYDQEDDDTINPLATVNEDLEMED
ncbi:uncharacterized protein N7518_002549 [Penicillium psychrosexuale]|uniref:uncharacterized protein n=1 Tax=Penicillium psychrosexuale TaxID=1002107 RepID=UPI0025453F95|nr:uncharacterized protein N7518_002549 [Penicillium psychrosexuale]KAJ5800481.1 hypothetical protein N7518_002549 [Penicillium psychrosexuale]